MEEQNGPVCGDAQCAASEVGVCTADCGTGGNNTNPGCVVDGQCSTTAGENAATCPQDCSAGGGSGSGSGSGSGTSTTCPADPLECFGCLLDPSACPSGHDANSCTTCILGSMGGGGGGGFSFCEGGAPDGTCNAAAQPPEDNTTCPDDCP